MMVDGDGKLLGEPLGGHREFRFYGAYVEEMVKKAIAAVRSGAPATAEQGAIVSGFLYFACVLTGCSPVVPSAWWLAP